ncbi:MAG: oligosaccharide flippase family protein [Acidimicrobiales bacterium]
MTERPARATGAAALVGARAGAFALSGVGAVIVARYLGPDRVGDVAAATSVVTILLVLGPFGVEQLYLQGRVDAATARHHLSRIAAISGAVAIVGSLLWPGLSGTARACGVLIGIAAAGDQLKVLWLCEPQYHLDFASRGRRDFAMRSVSVVLSALAAVVVGTALSVALGTLVASLSLLWFAWPRDRRGTGLWPASGPSPSTMPLRAVMRLGLPFALSAALSTIYFQADGAILASAASRHDIGLYRAAYGFIFAAVAVPVALNADVLRSSVYRAMERPGSLWRTAIRFGIVNAALGVGAALVLRELAHPLMRNLLGPAFVPAAPLLAVLALAMIPHYLNSWAGNLLIAIGFVRHVVVVQGGLAAVNVIGNLIAIPRYGPRGAAWMTVISECVGTAAYAALVIVHRHAIARRS